jgi:hypothetical protein
MKTMKSGLILLTMVLGNACVGYPYAYDATWDGAVSVEVSPDPWGGCWDCAAELEIELNWEPSSPCSQGCSNLDLEVTPPTFSTDCASLGDDPGGIFGGSETVICDNPAAGTYLVRAISLSDSRQNATVVVRKLEGNTILFESVREITVDPWSVSVVSVRID